MSEPSRPRSTHERSRLLCYFSPSITTSNGARCDPFSYWDWLLGSPTHDELRAGNAGRRGSRGVPASRSSATPRRHPDILGRFQSAAGVEAPTDSCVTPPVLGG